uniref:Uncharacterized protein n=1 Tax=Oryzias melastigma TaxID=30732 RepID=A0A3B3C0I6_ORYME
FFITCSGPGCSLFMGKSSARRHRAVQAEHLDQRPSSPLPHADDYDLGELLQGPIGVTGGAVVSRQGRGRWRRPPNSQRPGGHGRGLQRKKQQPEEHGCHEGGPDPGRFQPDGSS